MSSQPSAGQPRPPGGRVRNRYVDFVRLLAILMVVVGHWLNAVVVLDGQTPSGGRALGAADYMRWLTLAFQIMPLFFLASGYAAAASWSSWVSRGGGWAGWTHARLVRVLKPTAWFVAILASLTGVGVLAGVDPSVLDLAGWAVALQLWFLPVFLLLIVIAVPMITAWNRLGWVAVAAAIALVAVVDLLVRVAGLGAAGWANYLLAPAAGFVLGVAWHAGALARRPVGVGLAVGGLLGLLLLINVFGYPPWMIGVPGEPSNTSPPNLALAAYAAAQIGVILLLEQPARRWLERPRVWAVVVRGNLLLMTVYLWHMVPVVVLAGIMFALGVPTGPEPGSPGWWALRIPWIAALAVLLAPLVALMGRFELARPPRTGSGGPARAALLLASAGLTGFALSRLALDGFAPAGGLAVGPLLSFWAGMAALWMAGRVGGRGEEGTAASRASR